MALICKKYGNIIENKKTDSEAWLQKKKTWNVITEEFNASNNKQRTEENLKNKYLGIKKEIKRKKAIQKQNSYGTGGGPPKFCEFTMGEEIVDSILGTEVHGLNPMFDPDYVADGK